MASREAGEATAAGCRAGDYVKGYVCDGDPWLCPRCSDVWRASYATSGTRGQSPPHPKPCCGWSSTPRCHVFSDLGVPR